MNLWRLKSQARRYSWPYSDWANGLFEVFLDRWGIGGKGERLLRPTPCFSWSVKVITDHKSCTFYNTSQAFFYEDPVIEWISHLGFLLRIFFY